MEAHGHAISRDGRAYDNRSCIIFDVADGKLQRVIDDVDTELVSDVLFARTA
jgi:ketosteroid isomerase-like protein